MAVGTVKSQHVDTPYVTAANRTCGECRMLCWALAVVYIWFGALKPFGLSPADALVHKTVPFIPESLFLPFLGFWEVAIGVCFLFRRLLPSALALMGLQITGTLLPLLLLPEVCYIQFPWVLTLEGQYIVKNVVLIAAAVVLGHRAYRQCQEAD